MKTKLAVALFAVVLLAPGVAAAKAKEKANKTKCTNKLQAIADRYVDEAKRTVGLLLPAVQHLRAIGNDRGARRLTAATIARLHHHGHVTVLKLSDTAGGCLDGLDPDSDGDAISEIEEAYASAEDSVTSAEKRAVSAFRRVWIR